MRMEPTESSETSAINITWTPGTYPKDNKLQLEQGESLKSRTHSLFEALTLATAELQTMLSAEYLALRVRNMREIECIILLLLE